MKKRTPAEILDLFNEKKISKKQFVENVIALCELSEKKEVRMECLEMFNKVSMKNDSFFKFLENTAISESDFDMRIEAMNLILKHFPDKALGIIKFLSKTDETKKLVMMLIKNIGDNIITSDSHLDNQYAEFIKPIVFDVLDSADIESFHLLWGNWFYKISNDFWNFLSELDNPTGFLEIMDYNINNKEVYKWFFKILFKKITTEKWLNYLRNTRFSAQLFYILMYLAEEYPPVRFYELIGFFEEQKYHFNIVQKDFLIKILKKKNLYDLSIMLLFNWLIYLEEDKFKIVFSQEFGKDLILILAELIKNEKYRFLQYPYFFSSLVSFLLKIYHEINNNYLEKMFKIIEDSVKYDFITTLFSTLKYRSKKNLIIPKRKNLFKLRLKSVELLQILSEFYDIRSVYNNIKEKDLKLIK
jgi:hypothetical protein